MGFFGEVSLGQHQFNIYFLLKGEFYAYSSY
jgi:hypothetical protein